MHVTPADKPSLVWLRRNLRLDDNRALIAAAERGGAVIPFFIFGDDLDPASAGHWWLEHSLQAFQRDLRSARSRLILRSGDPAKVIPALVEETGAAAVFWDASFEPAQRRADERLSVILAREGVLGRSFHDGLLRDPAELLTKQGTPFKVFTPFWNHCLSRGEPSAPQKSPAFFRAPRVWPRSETCDERRCARALKWAVKMEPWWKPGEAGAWEHFRSFLGEKLGDYREGRDRPAEDGTSRLSPHLHFGEISVRRIWQEMQRHRAKDRRPGSARASEAFLRQILWREFAAGLLFHFPKTVNEPLRESFGKFEWKQDPQRLRAWQKGMTGYPIVDAGMRQLWATGWMHNRVRMIAASFLVKDLLIDWKKGAAWFMETLVDADLGNNTFGWQWVAGCGADAAPYFRIFNPVLQGEKFDPEGTYVRRWVPELAKAPKRFVHAPWKAPREVLDEAGVQLGRDYPAPIVDHDAARKRALLLYFRMEKTRVQ